MPLRAVRHSAVSMPHAALSEIESFLLERIASHEALRAVAWLAQHANTSLTARELAEKLGICDDEAEEALGSLLQAELVRREESVPPLYPYQACCSELDAALQRTLTLLEQDKLELVRMLAANSIHRLRRMAYLAYGPGPVKSTAPKGGSQS